MAKKSTGAPTPPAGNPTVSSAPEPINIKLEEPNATGRLFPEETPPAPEAPAAVPPVATPPAPAPQAPAEPAVAPQEPAQPAAAAAASAQPTPPAADEGTFLDDLIAKSNVDPEKVKVRIKVDGKDEVLSYSEAKKRVQLNEHLNLAGQKIGEERRALSEERRKFQEEQRMAPNLGARAPQGVPPTPGEPTPEELANPLVAKLYGELNVLKERVQGLDPVVFQTNRQRVANELKADGFNDFLDYIPKIEAHISKLQDPRAIEFYDSETGAKALYHQLKNRDLIEQMNQQASRPTTVQTPPVPAAPSRAAAEPPIVIIDSGTQPSQIGVDNYDAQYEEKLTRWKQTRDPKLFRELMKMRGA
jgi:hypothetical protein